MKKLTKVLCLLLAMLMIFSACGTAPEDNDKKKRKDDKPEPTAPVSDFEKDKAEYDAMTAEELVEKYVKDPSAITVEEYAALIATYAFVPDNGEGEFESDNKTKQAVDMVREAGSDLPSALNEELCSIMLAQPYPYARAYYYRLLINATAAEGSAVYEALLAQYQNETDPFVIACMVMGTARSLGVNPDYCAYVLALADSDYVPTRRFLATQFGSLDGADRDTLVEKAIALCGDEDLTVRNRALEMCGRIGDDRLVAPLSAVLKDMDMLSSHSAAAKGLLYMWYSPNNISEAAYNATMEYFRTESTEPKHPSWSAINLLTVKPGDMNKWREQATFFVAEELVAIMTTLVADADAEKLIKTNAVKVIALHGTADDLNALKPLVENSADKDAILKEIEKALEGK